MNRDETFLVQNHARNVPILRIVDESEGVYIEREIVRKGFERLEKQLLQFTKNEITAEKHKLI